MRYNIITILLLLVGLSSCQQDELTNNIPQPGSNGKGCSLSFVSDKKKKWKVTTRSSDPKDDDEKRINHLYIFFFGSDGEYLEGGYLEGYGNAPEQGGYYAPGEGVTTLKISNESTNFTSSELAKQATVYAVANVDPSLFRELDENGRPAQIENLSDLEDLIYQPSGALSIGLPANGMPMIGKKVIDLTSTDNERERTIDLKALMARIDVNIQLNSDITDNRLPSMLLTKWTVKNVPTQVSFSEPTDNATETGLSDDTKEDIVGSERTQLIYNNQGNISFTFYMFENRQNPKGTIVYPDGIETYQKQRYKPQLANENATYVEIQSEYTTYNNATYSVTYKLYLGSNHTDNFQVKRNHQYKNDITIKGLLGRDYADTGTGEGEDEKYTFDARVNVSEEENKYYIAMLRERNHDAHFCVTPMDVYLFDETNKPTLEVILGEVPDGSEEATNVPDWIGMEKIKAIDMEQGTVAESGFTPYNESTNEGTHLATGTSWTAGNGKRAFFTTNLVYELDEKITVDNTRDRVYFYIDENLTLQDRTAIVTLIYKENGQEVSRRTVEIGQVHLLPVTYTETQDGDGQEHTIYMEQYEEYLDHYDPLDEHATEQIYSGLPWAVAGTPLASNDIGTLRYDYGLLGRAYQSSFNNYYDGWEYTSYIVTIIAKEQSRMTLNDKPLSAFQYCHNKNKRNDTGIVPADYREGSLGGWIEEYNQSKWFLPAITQMEAALETYYTTYHEFQTDYYWSASAAKEGSMIFESEDGDRARATKVLPDGNHVSSDQQNSSMYPNGGNALRTEILRIRAFRIDLEPV